MPGTFQPDNDTQESTDPTEEDITITTVDSVSTTAITAIESTTKDSIFAIGGTLYYTVIGVGGGIIVLTFSFIIVCILIRYSVQRKRKSHTFTKAVTLQAHNGVQTQGMTIY